MITSRVFRLVYTNNCS